MSSVKQFIKKIDYSTLIKAFRLMTTARSMANLYDEEKEFASRYVHSTSKGHEAIQIAVGLQLKPQDYAALYYRDDSILLSLGFKPHELMMQLMAKAGDPFTGGRSYYCHPAVRRDDMPIIPHQSSATGMQVIPATGMAHGLKYLEEIDMAKEGRPIVLCSLGDGSMTEGEVSEAFQMAVLKELPIIYLVQDNDWGISASGDEMRAMDAYEFAAGFPGLKRYRVDGASFDQSYDVVYKAIRFVRNHRSPVLIHARCPLLGHHTSGVRKEWYRTDKDLGRHAEHDPLPKLEKLLQGMGTTEAELASFRQEQQMLVRKAFNKARNSPDPDLEKYNEYEFAPTAVLSEEGRRQGDQKEKVVMVDAALHAIDEILKKNPEALLYGQDVGARLGGVFREAATLADKYGSHRIFNTPIQEAYIVGSTVGMSAVGVKPIVEIQFADYIWPGMNQLVEELSKSCYLSEGKFPVQSLIRVPIGAYGGGGPYHSGSVESTLLTIRGIKVIYPSNSADMKGLIKAAFLDPNPVISLEHKGLYWSKVPGTEWAKMVEPDEDYIIPLGKANLVLEAGTEQVKEGGSVGIITYGMGVHWALKAAKNYPALISILDLRTLNPLDWEAIVSLVRTHNKVLLVTEEPIMNSFAESIAGRISSTLFKSLDAPVSILGAANVPAIPLNRDLEAKILPNAQSLSEKIGELLDY